MPVYILKQAASDCNLGGQDDLGNEISVGTESSNTIVVTVARGATEDSSVTVPSGVPNSDAWETGSHTVEVNVTVGQSLIDLQIAVRRVNSVCGTQETGSFTGVQTLTAGVKTFTVPGVSWSGELCGDRIQYVYRFIETGGGHGSGIAVTIETGTTDTEHTSPITEDAAACVPASENFHVRLPRQAVQEIF